MRVFTTADPRLIGSVDLFREHEDVHMLLRGGRHTDVEASRFPGERGRSLLLLRHEFIRVALAVRFGVDRHGRDTHRTPVDTTEMSQRASAALLMYERMALPPARQRMADSQSMFQRLVGLMQYPMDEPTTPWDARDLSLAQYVRETHAWTRKR